MPPRRPVERRHGPWWEAVVMERGCRPASACCSRSGMRRESNSQGRPPEANPSDAATLQITTVPVACARPSGAQVRRTLFGNEEVVLSSQVEGRSPLMTISATGAVEAVCSRSTTELRTQLREIEAGWSSERRRAARARVVRSNIISRAGVRGDADRSGVAEAQRDSLNVNLQHKRVRRRSAGGGKSMVSSASTCARGTTLSTSSRRSAQAARRRAGACTQEIAADSRCRSKVDASRQGVRRSLGASARLPTPERASPRGRRAQSERQTGGFL